MGTLHRGGVREDSWLGRNVWTKNYFTPLLQAQNNRRKNVT